MDSSDRTQGIWETLELLQVRLDKVSGARPDRRPRTTELDRLEVKQVRPLVQQGQQSVQLEVGSQRKQVWLTLDWLQRWGGTFGPKSSAEANRNRNVPSVDRYLKRLDQAAGELEVDPDRKADRGQVPAWLLYFSCSKCGRRCRVLYSLRNQHDYACPRCTKPCYPNRDTSPSGSSKSPWHKRERARIQHQLQASRIRRDYLQQTKPHRGLLVPHARTIPKPPRMTWERYEALCRLVEAHETLAMSYQLQGLHQSLNRITGANLHPTISERVNERDTASWAHRILRIDAWALRQRSWHRRGKPRDTPGQGTRAKLARMEETSADDPGHGETKGN